METSKTCLVFALALALASAGCSSDESASEADYPQPAASVGDEATPEEAVAEQTSPQSGASETMSPTEQPPVTAAPPTTAGTEESTASESLRDAQIVRIADLANAAEIEQANLAKTKAQNPRVVNFAQQMITQHTKAKQKVTQLTKTTNLTAEESNVAGELESKAAQTLDTLRNTDAASFDQVYMSAQVQQHQEVLQMLDDRLIPSATNPQLKAELEKTRDMVQKHLQDAQQIQQSLGST